MVEQPDEMAVPASPSTSGAENQAAADPLPPPPAASSPNYIVAIVSGPVPHSVSVQATSEAEAKELAFRKMGVRSTIHRVTVRKL